MDNNIFTEKLHKGICTAFENKNIKSDMEYRPQFIFNNFREGRKVLTSLERELKHCEEFSISVAFITMSGLTALLPIFKELEEKGVPGKILTTDYLHFSDPKALSKIQDFSNIELRLYKTNSEIGFHTKGYIFRNGDIYRIIVGSSNLTQNALTRNEEWNTQLVSKQEGEYTYTLIRRFEQLWTDNLNCKKYDDVKAEYEAVYRREKENRQNNNITDIDDYKTGIGLVADVPSNGYYAGIEGVTLKPNLMQAEFVESMRELHEKEAKRALLISATGTGKTYASAFAVNDYNPRRMLFIVHREQIAKQAMKSYKRVIGNRATMGVLSGTSKNIEAEYIFSTMQTISKEDIYRKFSPTEFDYIVIDEVHRAGAASYQKVFNYFTPKMYLGMTATPDRSDGYDIYSLFDHNIAYEIRLQQALEEDMLCPFHYFGITDIKLVDDNGNNDEDEEKFADFAKLTSDDRVRHILKQADYYGFSGKRVKGLIFCSRNAEAEELSRKFNQLGRRTINLSGNDRQDEREEAIERLISDDRDDYLEYIFTVDIFNEGVDVPEINQVIMLRPTQSAIVFIQQLGRGLRRYQDKEYVVILDFIGNYVGKNFMIPMALTGDRSYNKDNIRRCLLEGSRVIPGASTIYFDEIAKKRIFQSIDVTNISDLSRIKESYYSLRNKLGRIPSMMDFDKYGEMDIICMFRAKYRNKVLGSYHGFLKLFEQDNYEIEYSSLEENFIKFISMKLAEGKRPHELELLDILINDPGDVFGKLEWRLKEKWKIDFKANTITNLVNVMTANFITGSGAQSVADCVFVEKVGSEYVVSSKFATCLKNNNFKKDVKALIEFGLHRYKLNYSNPYKDSGFQLYQKYEYEDICRILNWTKNIVPLNIGGYKYDETTKTFPVFINYDKADNVQESINYHDRFLNNGQLISLSKNKRTLESEDVKRFSNALDLGIDVDLFVRKNKDDKIAKSFYYLGRMSMYDSKAVKMQGTGDDAVEMFWNLEVGVREDIYDYITSEDA